MARDGLRLFLCAGIVLGALSPSAGAGEDAEGRLRNQLAVQAALQQGLDHLQRGNYQAAVYALESQVARIDGNRRYLDALRDAYRGYVRELQQSNRSAEVPTYLHRLEILDPGSRLEQPAGSRQVPPGTAALTAATPPPARQEAAAPAPRPAAAPAPRVTRPQKADDDPFSDANRRQAHEARAILARADQEFAASHFEAAGRLYAQAHTAHATALETTHRERWAYCKLHGVVQALNQDGTSAASPAGLETEVRQALSMTPKLDAFGKNLLRKIQERRTSTQAPPTIQVQHTARPQGQAWAVAQTANFRILHNQSRAVAERVARVAEETRRAMFRKWFGEAPRPWEARCDIYLHASKDDYTRATGAPPDSPGHSTFKLEKDAGRVLFRRIDLRCDAPRLIEAVLPHETTHVVLAGRFGRHSVPRWADEGMAVLTEPRERIDAHLRNLPRHRQEGHLFGLGQLMQLDRYPDPRYIGPFYAQGVSLVDFLAGRNGPQVFARFLRDGLDGGYEPALRKHYGIQNFAELEKLWRQHAFGAATPVAQQR